MKGSLELELHAGDENKSHLSTYMKLICDTWLIKHRMKCCVSFGARAQMRTAFISWFIENKSKTAGYTIKSRSVVYSLYTSSYALSFETPTIPTLGLQEVRFTNKCALYICVQISIKYQKHYSGLHVSISIAVSEMVTAICIIHWWASLCHWYSLQWRHNERDGVSNYQPHDCLLNRLFKAQIKENLKAPRHWPFCGEFTSDRWIPCTKGQ